MREEREILFVPRNKGIVILPEVIRIYSDCVTPRGIFIRRGMWNRLCSRTRWHRKVKYYLQPVIIRRKIKDNNFLMSELMILNRKIPGD